MTPLRQRMIEDMQLHGLATKTQDTYLRAVKQLAEHYHKSPDLVTEEELRLYRELIGVAEHSLATAHQVHTLLGTRGKGVKAIALAATRAHFSVRSIRVSRQELAKHCAHKRGASYTVSHPGFPGRCASEPPFPPPASDRRDRS